MPNLPRRALFAAPVATLFLATAAMAKSPREQIVVTVKLGDILPSLAEPLEMLRWARAITEIPAVRALIRARNLADNNELAAIFGDRALQDHEATAPHFDTMRADVDYGEAQ